MADMKKAAEGLRQCLLRDDCGKCPYRENGSLECLTRLCNDTLELMGTREARLLTFDELMALPHGIETDVPVIFEQKVPVGTWDRGTLCQWKPAGFLQEMVEDHTWYNREQYGRIWRCWSARPTVKQREETKWG